MSTSEPTSNPMSIMYAPPVIPTPMNHASTSVPVNYVEYVDKIPVDVFNRGIIQKDTRACVNVTSGITNMEKFYTSNSSVTPCNGTIINPNSTLIKSMPSSTLAECATECDNLGPSCKLFTLSDNATNAFLYNALMPLDNQKLYCNFYDTRGLSNFDFAPTGSRNATTGVEPNTVSFTNTYIKKTANGVLNEDRIWIIKGDSIYLNQDSVNTLRKISTPSNKEIREETTYLQVAPYTATTKSVPYYFPIKNITIAINTEDYKPVKGVGLDTRVYTFVGSDSNGYICYSNDGGITWTRYTGFSGGYARSRILYNNASVLITSYSDNNAYLWRNNASVGIWSGGTAGAAVDFRTGKFILTNHGGNTGYEVFNSDGTHSGTIPSPSGTTTMYPKNIYCASYYTSDGYFKGSRIYAQVQVNDTDWRLIYFSVPYNESASVDGTNATTGITTECDPDGYTYSTMKYGTMGSWSGRSIGDPSGELTKNIVKIMVNKCKVNSSGGFSETLYVLYKDSFSADSKGRLYSTTNANSTSRVWTLINSDITDFTVAPTYFGKPVCTTTGGCSVF